MHMLFRLDLFVFEFFLFLFFWIVILWNSSFNQKLFIINIYDSIFIVIKAGVRVIWSKCMICSALGWSSEFLGSVGLLIIHMIHSLLVATETSVECQVWTLCRFRAIKCFETSRECTIQKREQWRQTRANKELKMERAKEAGKEQHVLHFRLTSLTRHGYVDQPLIPALTSSEDWLRMSEKGSR